MEDQVEATFPNAKLTESVKSVMDCLAKKGLMTIFQLDSSDSAMEIDETILQALQKG